MAFITAADAGKELEVIWKFNNFNKVVAYKLNDWLVFAVHCIITWIYYVVSMKSRNTYPFIVPALFIKTDQEHSFFFQNKLFHNRHVIC